MRTKSTASLLLMFLLSACSSSSSPEPHTLEANRTSSCQEEIEQSIFELIQAKNLSISKDVFSKTSSLHLSNQKNGILRKSPIYNDIKGRKSLILYKENDDLFIGLMNEKKDVIKSKKLQKCL